MWLFLGLLIGGLVLVVLRDVLSRHLRHNDLILSVFKFGGIIAEMLFALFAVFTLCFTYPSSLDTVAGMENFYDRNRRIFLEAVDVFPDAVTVKTGNATTETVRLSRDYIKEVLKYNRNLQWYRNYQNHWFLGAFIATVPDRLQFIELRGASGHR